MKNLIFILTFFFSLSSIAQMIECDMIELSVVNTENNIGSFELTTNIPEDPSSDYLWTLISSNGDILMSDNSAILTVNDLSPNEAELIVCLDISFANFVFDSLSCSICQPLMWTDNAWVVAEEGGEGNEGGEGGEGGEGNEGGEDNLVFEIDCNGEWIEVNASELGMSEESLFDMLNSDINNDGYVNEEDMDMLAFLFGCNDIEWEGDNIPDSIPVDSTVLEVYTFMCDDEFITVSPYDLGFSAEEFELLMNDYDIENSEFDSPENFLAMLFGCDEAEWNDDLGNEEDLAYESFVFECDGLVITLDYEDMDMAITDFTDLLNMDLNQDDLLNEEDLAYLFGCDEDSINVNWLSAINNGDMPDGFTEYIYAMMSSGAQSFSYMDFLNSTQTSIQSNVMSPKRLLRITNIMGEKVPFKTNQIQFYLFDDGSTEKRLIIE